MCMCLTPLKFHVQYRRSMLQYKIEAHIHEPVPLIGFTEPLTIVYITYAKFLSPGLEPNRPWDSHWYKI